MQASDGTDVDARIAELLDQETFAPPERAAPNYRANPGAGRIERILGRGWKRR